MFLKDPSGMPRHRENREFYKFIFTDGENTGDLSENIKNLFLHREFTSTQGKLLKFKQCSRVAVGCSYDLPTLTVDF